MRETYKTRQRQLIVDTLKTNTGAHMSASDIAHYLKNKGYDVGIATIYRQLSRLTSVGVIQRFSMDGTQTSYYEYMSADKEPHFHFKCEKCNKFIHFDCCELKQLHHHLSVQHGFDMNSMKTVIYGICNECAVKSSILARKHRTSNHIYRSPRVNQGAAKG